MNGTSHAEIWNCSCSDISTFFDDVQVVRPTAMMLIPRLTNIMYDQAQEKLRGAERRDKQVPAPHGLTAKG